MIKYLIIFFLILELSASSQTEITANRFELDPQNNITKFIGNVNVKNKSDSILADIINVYTDKNNEPIKYEALNNVKFKIESEKIFYQGSCNSLIFYPLEKIYTLLGSVKVYEEDMSKLLSGEKIIIYQNSGKAEVIGNDKPVKFIFGQSN